MSCFLRNSRSVLLTRLTLRRPPPQPLTRRYQRPRSPPLARGWYRKPWKVAAAGVLAYSTASLLPHAAAACVIWGLLSKETVPYTSRVHRVVLLPIDGPEFDDFDSDAIKNEHGDTILGPSDPSTVRVRRITDDLIRGIHRVLLAESPYDDDNHGDDPSLKGRDKVPNGGRNKQLGKATAVPPQTGHLKELNWEVFVVKDEGGSAYTKYNGKIVICTGLLNHLDTDAEIATFLAHEMGHTVARHQLQFDRIVEIFSPFLYRLLPFSRRDEIEADHIGIMLLAAAGFDPRVAPRIFQKRGETIGESALQDHISTHPSYQTRARLLSEGKVMEEALKLYHKQVRAREGAD